MQLSVATLSAILATLAQAAPTGPLDGLPILGRNLPVPEDAAFAYPPQQPGFQPHPNKADDSSDVVSVLSHTKLLDGNGINVLGQSANGGIGKRQDDSKDVVSALSHSGVLDNNGLNVAGQSADGGVDASRLQHKFQPARQPSPAVVPVPAQWAPEPSRDNVVGPSFVANQAQAINQQAANAQNP